MRRLFGAVLAFTLAAAVAAGQPAPGQQAPELERPVSLKLLPSNLVSDQKSIWLFPRRLAHPRNWIAPAAVVGATALLIAEVDAPTASYFRRTSSFDGFKQVFTGKATALGMVALPSSLLAAGLARHDSKMWKTAVLAGEAVLDSEVLTIAMKDADRRLFPASVPPEQGFSNTWFKTSGHWLRGSGSFPSGHGIAAVSIATVFARRYGKRRWVSYAAYGAAGLVAFSRLPLGAHYVSDTFMGAALGYSISRFAVLRQ
jgi:membrane-associated phospholipid phosphatase